MVVCSVLSCYSRRTTHHSNDMIIIFIFLTNCYYIPILYVNRAMYPPAIHHNLGTVSVICRKLDEPDLVSPPGKTDFLPQEKEMCGQVFKKKEFGAIQKAG